MDGKFYTSAGITSGIDMALRVVADIVGEETARKIQLAIEYDPAPPFPGGTPFTSPPEIVKAVLDGSRQRRADREKLLLLVCAVRCHCRWRPTMDSANLGGSRASIGEATR